MNSRFLPVAWLLGLVLVVADAAPTHSATVAHLWSQRFGDVTDSQRATSVAVDASGNVILLGDFQGSVNFGGATLTSAGGVDIYLAKFSAAGVHQWSKRFGGTGDQSGASVAVDGSGNIAITGTYLGTVNFGGSTLTSLGSGDIYIAKFDPNGVHQWSKTAGDGGIQNGTDVATDASGNVIAIGTFSGTVNFGGSNLTSAGGYDIYLAAFNSAGTHQWSQRFGDIDYQYGISVATDASGNVILLSQLSGTVNFGGSNLTSAGADDIALAKFNSAGTHQWSQRFGDLFEQNPLAVTTDDAGNIVLTGIFVGTLNFGGSNLTGGFGSICLAKFNGAGVHQWSTAGFGGGNPAAPSVATDASGNVLLTGQFCCATIDFGGGPLANAGGIDIFVAKFNAGGGHQWSRSYGDASDQFGSAVAADATGDVIAAGRFNGTINFGGSNLTSAGGSDIWLAKFGGTTGEPSIQSIVDVGNDQGRHVKITLARSGFDDASAASPITQYEAFRRDDPVPLFAAVPDATKAPGPGWSREALLAHGWQFVGAAPAHGEASYILGAPTVADSTIAKGQYYSWFFIRAATSNPFVFYDSVADSGYSVDNIAPPAPLNAAYGAGTLSWQKSPAADFDYFSVYGSASASFDGSAVLIGYTIGTNYNVSGSPHVFYYITATDFSGNEGRAARVNTLTGTGGTPPGYNLAVSAYPNPFNPQTTIRYDVPSEGPVVVSVYDAGGARVATLIDTTKPAGSYTVRWEGRDARGAPVSSGVYFVKVEFGGDTRTRKIALVK